MQKKIYIFSIFIFLLLSFSSILNIENLYDKKRVSQILFIFIIFILFFGSIKLSLQVKLLFTLVFIIGFISVLLSNNFLYSTLQLTHAFLLVHLIIFGMYIQTRVNSIFRLLFFSNLFLVCMSILNYSFFLLDRSVPVIFDILYGFNNIRFFNQFQVICLPIILYFTLHLKLSRVASILLTLNLLLFLISGARGAMLSSLLMLFIGLSINLVSRRALIKLVQCSVIAGLIFCLYINFHSKTEIAAYTFRVTSSGRIDIWSNLLLKLEWLNLVIGNGPGLYFIDELKLKLSHPHNSILQLIYNWGGVATFIILLASAKLFIKCLAHINHKIPDPQFNCCFLIITNSLCYSLFSGVLVMPLPQTFLFIFLGILIGFTSPKPKRNKRSNKKLFLMLIIAAFYIGITLLSYNCISSKAFGPNFWSNGQLSFSECKLPYKEN